MASALRNNKNLDYVVLASVDGAKVTFVASASKAYDAVKLVKALTSITGGGGGGKPDLAQAGGRDSSKVNEALNFVKENIK